MRGRRRDTVGRFLFSLCWFTSFFFNFYLFVIFLIQSDWVLGLQIFCVGNDSSYVEKSKTNMIRRRSWSSPDFSKIKMVQNRAILDTSDRLSWHNKRIDCPF